MNLNNDPVTRYDRELADILMPVVRLLNHGRLTWHERTTCASAMRATLLQHGLLRDECVRHMSDGAQRGASASVSPRENAEAK